jgi:tetratricopeptide (TPR) repeat protein
MSEELLSRARMAAQNNNHTRAIQLYDQLLAKTANDPSLKDLRVITFQEQGKLLRIIGLPEEALATFQHFYLEAGTSQQAVDALFLIGDQHTRMNQFQKALDSFQEGLELAEALNYTGGRAKILQGFGSALQYIGRTEEAIPHLKKAISLFEQLEDPGGLLSSWVWLGMTYLGEGTLDKAITAFQSSLAFGRQLGKRETAVVLNNLGECYQNLYHLEAALDAHQEGLKLTKEIKIRASEADLARNLGVDLWQLGQIDEALNYLHQALEISRETKNTDVALQTLYSLALVEIERGRLEQGYQYAQEMKKLVDETGARTYLGEALHAIGMYYKAKGEWMAAQQTWQEAVFMAHETSRRIVLWQLHAGLASISENESLAAVHYRIAAEVINQIAYPIQDEALREKFLTSQPIREILEAAKVA